MLLAVLLTADDSDAVLALLINVAVKKIGACLLAHTLNSHEGLYNPASRPVFLLD